jgi:hypothetical protein
MTMGYYHSPPDKWSHNEKVLLLDLVLDQEQKSKHEKLLIKAITEGETLNVKDRETIDKLFSHVINGPPSEENENLIHEENRPFNVGFLAGDYKSEPFSFPGGFIIEMKKSAKVNMAHLDMIRASLGCHGGKAAMIHPWIFGQYKFFLSDSAQSSETETALTQSAPCAQSAKSEETNAEFFLKRTKEKWEFYAKEKNFASLESKKRTNGFAVMETQSEMFKDTSSYTDLYEHSIPHFSDYQQAPINNFFHNSSGEIRDVNDLKWWPASIGTGGFIGLFYKSYDIKKKDLFCTKRRRKRRRRRRRRRR